MKTIRFSATDYYSVHQALRAAQQLLEVLRQDHERGFFELDEVKLRSGDTDLVFTGAEYLAFAERGVQDAVAMTHPGRAEKEAPRNSALEPPRQNSQGRAKEG